MHLSSDILTTALNGDINFDKIIEDLSFVISVCVPNFIDSSKHNIYRDDHTYDITISFNDFDKFSSIFIPNLSISKGSLVELAFNSQDTIFSIHPIRQD